jgi:propanol-preferring alcohol dehydrogenase
VIAVDTSVEKLALAREVGADETVEPGEDAADRIRELTGGRGAELVLDDVGADATLALGAAISRFEGHLTVVGLAGGTLPFAFGALPFESQLTIPYWGTAVELDEVLDLARAGKIRAHVERFPLDRVEDAYTRMRDGTLDGRAVICPNG